MILRRKLTVTALLSIAVLVSLCNKVAVDAFSTSSTFGSTFDSQLPILQGSHRYQQFIVSNQPKERSSALTQLNAEASSAGPGSSPSRRFQKLVSEPDAKRPDWALDWMPTWAVTMRSSVQFIVMMVLYIFHLKVLTQSSIPFPFQLIPNEKGHFQSIGLDSIVGMASLAAYVAIRKQQQKTKGQDEGSVLPHLLSSPKVRQVPWKEVYKSQYSQFSSFFALAGLCRAYFWTGGISLWWEDAFYVLGNYLPITIPMHRALCVLASHLSWVGVGTLILRLVPRPQPFFDKWYTTKLKKTQWLWWTIGGYFVSSWFFNIADLVNQWILPLGILEQATDSIVTQLVNPEFNDRWASLIGFIAPCISAPWWEEVLYRGFLLPALTLQMEFKWAIFWSGIIFSVHHLSPTGALPLCVLGWTWNLLYTKSGNLFSTIMIHAMWNSRVFLGSWMGL